MTTPTPAASFLPTRAQQKPCKAWRIAVTMIDRVIASQGTSAACRTWSSYFVGCPQHAITADAMKYRLKELGVL